MEALVFIIAIALSVSFFLYKSWLDKDYNKSIRTIYESKTDKELIDAFKNCATKVQLELSAGGGMVGFGARTATNAVNKRIEKARTEGEIIASILTARGYKVDTSVLQGMVTKGKANSDVANVIKGAVVGGVIAGDVGAIVGAAHAMKKNEKK